MSVRGGGGCYVSKGVTDSVREVSKGGYCSVRGLLTQGRLVTLTAPNGGGLLTFFNFVYRRDMGREAHVLP